MGKSLDSAWRRSHARSAHQVSSARQLPRHCFVAAITDNARLRSQTAHKDHRGVDLISDVLPFGRLWYDTPDNAVGYAMHYSRSHDAVIRVYDDAGNVIETGEHKGEFKEP